MKKRNLIILRSLILLFGILFLPAMISAICAERTLDGAWCQNVPASEADTSINPLTGEPYHTASTSCENTRFCEMGTCVDTDRGECFPNTPRVVCNQEDGFWDSRDFEDVPQCQLGCCILGDQASFTTEATCEVFSSDFDLEIDFRANIRDELTCIASANPHVMGACVFEEETGRTCNLLNKENCQNFKAINPGKNVRFHEGFLCSAEFLGADCGRSDKTTCVASEDEVRFLDTCGNLANIYDSSRVDDRDYWEYIIGKADSCNPDSSNANSRSCGNCDYLLGSTCREFERGETAKPNVGDNICKDLACEWDRERYEHGEAWCETSSQTREGENLPGEEHFVLKCYNNEVTFEQCAAFRNEVCTESSRSDGFSFAICRINEWGECALQDNKVDCNNEQVRDCQWVEGETNYPFITEEGGKYVMNSEGKLVEPEDEDDDRIGAACIPKYAPGFNWWTETGVDESRDAEESCPIVQDGGVVKFGDGLFSGWECKEDCEYIDPRDREDVHPDDARVNPEWEAKRNVLCKNIGDCGSSVNYYGVEGYNDGKATKIKEQLPEDD